MSIRPERITVGPSGSNIEGGLRAILENLVYVGNALHLHMRTIGGTPLIGYQQNSTALSADLAPGAEVHAWLQPDSVGSSSTDLLVQPRYSTGQHPGTLTPVRPSNFSLSSMQREMTSSSSMVRTLPLSSTSRPLTYTVSTERPSAE